MVTLAFFRYNLSHMEQWLRDNKLNESGAQSALDPIVQASQLLQARKTDTDVDSICEMCSKLTLAQVSTVQCLFSTNKQYLCEILELIANSPALQCLILLVLQCLILLVFITDSPTLQC